MSVFATSQTSISQGDKSKLIGILTENVSDLESLVESNNFTKHCINDIKSVIENINC